MNNGNILFLFFICFFLIFHQPLSAQSSYYKKDTTTFYGKKLLRGSARSNTYYVKVRKDRDTTLTFTPYEVSEYGYEKGPYYKAFPIDSSGQEVRYFFKQLFKDNIGLYYLDIKGDKKGYYLDLQDGLPMKFIPQKRKASRAFLSQHLKDCEKTQKDIKNFNFSKGQLVRLFEDYVSCSSRYWNRLRFEVHAGPSIHKLSPHRSDLLFGEASYSYAPGYFVGARVALPLGGSNFSIHSGVGFGDYRSKNPFETSAGGYELITKENRVQIPLSVRYSLFNLKSVPFLELGGIYSQRIANTNTLYYYRTGGAVSDIFITREESTAIPSQHIGGFIGAGMIFGYSNKFSYFFKISYTQLYPYQAPQRSFGLEEFKLTIGTLF